MRSVPYLHQNHSTTCGCASINMVYGYLSKAKIDLEFAIAKIAGTSMTPATYTKCEKHDNCIGTCEWKMAKALTWLGIEFREPRVNNTEYLVESLKHNLIILRTLTHGFKHWVVLTDYDIKTKLFQVNDPAFGKIQYTHKEVYNIWSVRNFDFFEIPADQKPRDVISVRNDAMKLFGDH